MKGTCIHIPMHTRTDKSAHMDAFFPVETQKYIREDGTDDGLRAIVNMNTKDTLGRISEGYKVVTHKEVSDTIQNLFTDIGIKFTSNPKDIRVGTKGARFFQTIYFPDLSFNPAKNLGIPSTALDIGGHNFLDEEVLVPFVKARNSYNKTERLGFGYGCARLRCTNGMALLVSETSLFYRHNQEFDLEKIKNVLFERIQENSSLVEKVYARLNQEKGINYLQNLIDGDFPAKFKLAVLEKMAPYATIKSVRKPLVEGEKREVLEIESIKTDVSGWAVYNVATDVSTHQIASAVEQDVLDRRIAKAFNVR